MTEDFIRLSKQDITDLTFCLTAEVEVCRKMIKRDRLRYMNPEDLEKRIDRLIKLCDKLANYEIAK